MVIWAGKGTEGLMILDFRFLICCAVLRAGDLLLLVLSLRSATGGDWRLAILDWRLAAAGSLAALTGGRLAIGDWRFLIGDWLPLVLSLRSATGGDWRLAIGDWRFSILDWRLAAAGSLATLGYRCSSAVTEKPHATAAGWGFQSWWLYDAGRLTTSVSLSALLTVDVGVLGQIPPAGLAVDLDGVAAAEKSR